MNSKERVISAFEFVQPDYSPIDIYTTPEVHQTLAAWFNVKSINEVREAVGSDIRYVNPEYIGPELPVSEYGTQMDIWGIIKKKANNEFGYYMEPVNYPYASWETAEEAKQFTWPDPDWFSYDSIATQCRQYPEEAVFTGGFQVQDFINGVAFGRGVEQVLIDIADGNPVYLYIIEKRHKFFMEYIERILIAGNGLIDAVLCGDDFGTQRGLLISPSTFDTIFAPYKKEFFDMVHSYGAKITHHCCGSSRDLLPRFIELGMDALQTIQPKAEGMDPFRLKKDFDGMIVLHGGVDAQGWLQNSDKEEIRGHIHKMQEILGKGGGFIMSPSHQIQPDTPLEMILAFYEAALEERK